jgi:hypothetical protein
VHPRKPSNWLLTIASNAIKQRFRQEQARPRVVELDERTAAAKAVEEDGPTVRELLSALSKIPPQQRQAIVLREFEGRSYAEIADILGVTTSALETLLFRARRSLVEELEQRLSCTEAQLAISRAVDDRLGRKERRRLREHLAACPDCAHFAGMQQRHRRALKGLMLLPVPLSLTLAKGMEGTAAAATLPVAATATTIGVGTGVGAASATGGGAIAGGLALKAAAVVTAATVASGVAVTGSSEDGVAPPRAKPAASLENGERVGQVAPRGVVVPGNGVARGKADAPGQAKSADARSRGDERRAAPKPEARGSRAAANAEQKSKTRANGKPSAPGQTRLAEPRTAAPKTEKQAEATAKPPKPVDRTAVTKAAAKPPQPGGGNGGGPKAP